MDWEDVPYGDYLNAVDDVLESRHGRTSTQEELAYIAECQEATCPPSECAPSVMVLAGGELPFFQSLEKLAEKVSNIGNERVSSKT